MIIRTLSTIDQTVVVHRARRRIIAADLFVLVLCVARQERLDGCIATDVRTRVFVGRRAGRLIAAATVAQQWHTCLNVQGGLDDFVFLLAYLANGNIDLKVGQLFKLFERLSVYPITRA